MHIEDIQRLVTEIETLKVVLHLVMSRGGDLIPVRWRNYMSMVSVPLHKYVLVAVSECLQQIKLGTKPRHCHKDSNNFFFHQLRCNIFEQKL
jgi:hypothetical protein